MPKDAQSSDADLDLVALVGSRLCHDLISPLGAIGNGVELLEMSGAAQTPEIRLIADSVAAANARLRFFRIAFGRAEADQIMARADMSRLMADISRGDRILRDWRVNGDTPRSLARIGCLAMLCLETALPRGGALTAGAHGAGGLRLQAEGPSARADPDLWRALDGAAPPLGPGQVQFALLPRAARTLDLNLSWSAAGPGVEIHIGP